MYAAFQLVGWRRPDDNPVGSKHVATLIIINQVCLTDIFLLILVPSYTSGWLPSKGILVPSYTSGWLPSKGIFFSLLQKRAA
jgi:hypothetical protein